MLNSAPVLIQKRPALDFRFWHFLAVRSRQIISPLYASVALTGNEENSYTCIRRSSQGWSELMHDKSFPKCLRPIKSLRCCFYIIPFLQEWFTFLNRKNLLFIITFTMSMTIWTVNDFPPHLTSITIYILYKSQILANILSTA